MFDKACYGVQTIGEVVAAELVSGVIHRVKERIGTADREFVRQLMEINNVRPQIDAFWWLEWFGRTALDAHKKSVLLDALRQSLSAALQTTLAERWDDLVAGFSVFRGDLTDKMEHLLSFLGDNTYDGLKRKLRLFNFFRGILGNLEHDWAEAARREWELDLPDGIQYLVHGHTHEVRTEYFSGFPDNKVRMYINTGTYLPLIRRARDGGFALEHQMTMTFFYRADEDIDGKRGKVPSMEMWSGIKRKAYA
jgi:hypothetical protein